MPAAEAQSRWAALAMLPTPALLLLGGALIGTDCPPALHAGAWFCGMRQVDLTGDDRADTIIVRATGRSSDSLQISLTIRVGGKEAWREDWASSYELVDPPDFSGTAERDEYLRRRLRGTLEDVKVRGFDRTGYEMMADAPDSLLLREPPRFEVRFSYGYETTVVLMWDQAAGRFHGLWSCC